jgi:hypothetical protein
MPFTVILIILIVILCALLFGKPFKPDSGRLSYNRLSVGKTEEQKKVLRYFLLKNDGGCLAKEKDNLVSDSEFDKLAGNFLSKNNTKQEALDRIGVDESQVQEVEPINFFGFIYGGVNHRKVNNSGMLVSSSFQITWLFFSKDQLYLFQKTTKMDENSPKFRTEEYFYKDIVNFSTKTEERKFAGKQVIENTFSVIVPGDKFDCTLRDMDSAEKSIRAMKAKLREKKNT